MPKIEIELAHYKTVVRSHELACQLYDAWAGDPWGESQELIRNRFEALMQWIQTLDVDEDGSVCGDCSGSGQGMTENSICRTCGGTGEV